MGLPLFPFSVDQKYEAVKLLGKGGGGYAVLAQKNKKEIAIKFLNLSLVKDAQKNIQKFKKEFLTLKKLNHPHIGKLYDFGYDAALQFYYFAGEYISGQDIRTACQHLPVEAIEKLFVQALQALHYLHSFGRAGLRHNDIKSANVLVTREKGKPQLKLIDFGLTNLSPLGVKGGTASYMAPEQILVMYPNVNPKKLPKPDHRADLYSLGVLWYFCLTGVNPFLVEHDTPLTLRRHFESIPPPPSSLRKEVPAYLDKIILKLLKENPDERYASAAEIIQELRYLGGRSYSALPSSHQRYFLPEGEWIGNSSVLKSLQEGWGRRLSNPASDPEIIWIVGHHGQGKTKILEHFKNYVQSHEGCWVLPFEAEELDFSQPLVAAFDDFKPNTANAKKSEALFEKIKYAKHWEPGKPIPWLFVFTQSQAPQEKPPLPSRTLHLKNFSTEELQDFVRRIAPRKEITPPSTFIQKLHALTDGNPLFVTSVLKVLGEKGLLWNNDGTWHPSLLQDKGISFAKLPLPTDLKSALQHDWILRTSEEKEILKQCACFPDGTPSAFFEETEALQRLLSLGLLTWNAKRQLQFKNSFFQKMAYNQLTAGEKEKRHRQIARFFQKEKKPPHWSAYHLAKTGKKEDRLKALETLAQFYTGTGRLDEALEARKEALTLLQKSGLTKKLEMVIPTIRLIKNLRRWEEAHTLTRQWLKKIPTSATYKGWKGALLREQGVLFLAQNRWQEARSCFEKGLGAIQPVHGHLKEKLILENMIAKTWLDERKFDQAVTIYQKTRGAAKKLRPSEAKEVLNNDLGYAYLLLQKSEEGIGTLTEDLKLMEEAGDKSRRLRCHFLLGSAHRKLLRDFPKAIHHYQAGFELAKDLKDYDSQMRALNGLAATYLDSAHTQGGGQALPQALRYFEESLNLCHHLKQDTRTLDFETAAIYLNIGTVHQEMGHFVKAYDTFQTILAVLEKKQKKESREWTRLCETYIALAENLGLQTKHPEMLEPIQKGWEIAKTSPSLLEHQLALQILWAEWAKATNNLSQLKEHLGLAVALRNQHHIEPTSIAKKKMEELSLEI